MVQPQLFHPPITLSQLESHLWEAANILRGSPVDRTDWKSYILPLLFFKRICDVWDEEYQEMVETYGMDFEDEHRFQVPTGYHWRDVRETPVATSYGAFHLLPPNMVISLIPIPSNGVLGIPEKPATIPPSVPAPYDIPMQGLVGLNSDSLTNLCVLEVR